MFILHLRGKGEVCVTEISFTETEKKKKKVNSLLILCQVIVHHHHNLLIWDAILVDDLISMAGIGLVEGKQHWMKV